MISVCYSIAEAHQNIVILIMTFLLVHLLFPIHCMLAAAEDIKGGNSEGSIADGIIDFLFSLLSYFQVSINLSKSHTFSVNKELVQCL